MSEYLNELIMNALDEILDINDVEEYKEYYKLYNPLSPDSETKSAMIFKEDGALRMFNSSIEILGKQKTTLMLTEWLRLTNTLKYYIEYIRIKFNISFEELSLYKEDLLSFLFFSTTYKLKKYRFDWIRKTLYKSFILDKDIFEIQGKVEFKKISKEKTVNKIDSKIDIISPNSYEEEAINKYRITRKINSHKNVKNVIVLINELYRKCGISFYYGNGFTKIRIINENKFRYFCQGKYEELFEVRVNNTKTCFIIEGEINALSIQDYIKDDIYSLHNVNSIPTNLYQLKNYEKIIIKIDKDKFTETKKLFIEKIRNKLQDKEVTIDYATDNEGDDFNSLHQNNLLSTEVIYKINENSR